MALFTNTQKSESNSIYERAKKHLKPKDGKVHIIMFNSFSKLANQVFGCDEKYTIELDEIITNLQNDDYEIVDIKLTAIANQGALGQREGFNTLIMYK